MTVAARLRANAALLDLLIRSGRRPRVSDLRGLVADMLRDAAEVEALEGAEADVLAAAKERMAA